MRQFFRHPTEEVNDRLVPMVAQAVGKQHGESIARPLEINQAMFSSLLHRFSEPADGFLLAAIKNGYVRIISIIDVDRGPAVELEQIGPHPLTCEQHSNADAAAYHGRFLESKASPTADCHSGAGVSH
jgi:hypothetical protein